jgi:hypothetical protein
MSVLPPSPKATFREAVIRELVDIGSRYGLPDLALEKWTAMPDVHKQIELFHGGDRTATTVATLLFRDLLAELSELDVGVDASSYRSASNAAERLRAQKSYSTDPHYLEQMAREVEARKLRDTRPHVTNVARRTLRQRTTEGRQE